MSLTILLLSLLVVCHKSTKANTDFTFHGFKTANLTLDGVTEIRPNGLLALTNGTRQKTGFAFYPNQIIFKNSSTNVSSMTSFSTTFVFGIIPEFSTLGGHGFSFVIAPQPGLPGALPNQHMGLFNKSNNNGNITNHIIAVELDTMQSPEFHDINDNHVGIDINRLDSVVSRSAGYYSNNFQTLRLISGKPMRVWIEYDDWNKQMSVTIASFEMKKPSRPLLFLDRDLSEYINSEMYVGFASSTGSVFSYHYLLGWSFKINGQAQELENSMLPKLPRIGPKKVSKFLTIGLPLIISFVVVTVIVIVVYYVRRKEKFAEEIEDWELEYGPHRFKYKDLYFATKGFSDNELLGTGGFGQVYRGFLANSKTEIAVKRVSHQSRQGMKEFVAEIVSMGQLRHRNLVQLIGYCRRKKELLLVYEYMSGGSLDKLLYNKLGFTLSWSQRFLVIKGVASGLFYLHEGWEQVVIHRDVKSGNVLLDKELNGKLGDFGLARLYNHGDVPHTTHVVGTLGYLAPEQMWTGKVTEATDVFSFGAFLLEVACGRRPVGFKEDKFRLVEWVFRFWKKGLIFNAVDPNLGGVFDCDDVKLVMKLGLLCSNTNPLARPTMRQVVEYLEKDVAMPEPSSSIGISASNISFGRKERFNDLDMYPSSMDHETFTHGSSMDESLLFGSR